MPAVGHRDPQIMQRPPKRVLDTPPWLLAPGSCVPYVPFVLIQQFFQYLPRAGDGPGAVADDVLLVLRQLRHRRRVLRHPEDRIVTEASFAPPAPPLSARTLLPPPSARHPFRGSATAITQRNRARRCSRGRPASRRSISAKRSAYEALFAEKARRVERPARRPSPRSRCPSRRPASPGRSPRAPRWAFIVAFASYVSPVSSISCIDAPLTRRHDIPAAAVEEHVVLRELASIVRGEQQSRHGRRVPNAM